jgi:hypothetical protein
VAAAVAAVPVQSLCGDRSVEVMLSVGRLTDLRTPPSLAGHMRYDAPRMVQMQERLHVQMRDRQSREGPFT